MFRDDFELREGSFGVPLPLDPGRHVFVVRSPGRTDAREEVTLREGQETQLALNVGQAKKEPDIAAAADADAQRRRLTLAFGALGVGAAGVATGIVTGLMFSSSASTYRDHCDASGCDPVGLSAASEAKTLNVVSPIAFGVGAVGVGVGAYLFLSRPVARHGRVQVSPQVSPQHAGLTLTGRF